MPSTMLNTKIIFQDCPPKLFIELRDFQIVSQYIYLHPYINPPSNIQPIQALWA